MGTRSPFSGRLVRAVLGERGELSVTQEAQSQSLGQLGRGQAAAASGDVSSHSPGSQSPPGSGVPVGLALPVSRLLPLHSNSLNTTRSCGYVGHGLSGLGMGTHVCHLEHRTKPVPPLYLSGVRGWWGPGCISIRRDSGHRTPGASTVPLYLAGLFSPKYLRAHSWKGWDLVT